MPVGEKDKKGNLSILGGWKTDLYLLPTGQYLLEGVETQSICQTPKKAIQTYNKLNNTSLPKDHIETIFWPWYLNTIGGEGLPLPLETSTTVGKFESTSHPGDLHYVKRVPSGALICTCTGFGVYKHCWHINFIKFIEEVGGSNGN